MDDPDQDPDQNLGRDPGRDPGRNPDDDPDRDPGASPGKKGEVAELDAGAGGAGGADLMRPADVKKPANLKTAPEVEAEAEEASLEMRERQDFDLKTPSNQPAPLPTNRPPTLVEIAKAVAHTSSSGHRFRN
ncbi:hypothetical protein K490DRAFT_69435 [Saccharata proteae CBS 121410]|uniref:Uncharacterized protein n=1 Tax=Saccharata proteae CBS 121410 TaxID=1314787 RepID=A0A9P4LWA8_9PEZI|nr:hypothetical protein K490DRAFT_69435 [Saccharata proteae CBS 121410]